MYECDAKYGPPEKYPEMSVQRGFILMSRRFERESKGCEAVGEKHEFVTETRPSVAILNADKSILGDLNMLEDVRARFATPGYVITGQQICRHCKRRK